MGLTRNLATALALILVGSVTAADPVRWRTDYGAARKEAAQRKLPLLIVVSTTDCVYCRKMEAGTFLEPETVKLLEERFIPVKLDAARDAEFVRGMKITLFPTTVIAGHEGKVYAYLAGFLTGASFRENANKALALVPPLPKPEVAGVLLAKRKPSESPLNSSSPSAAERLTAAKAAFTAEQFIEARERCQLLIVQHPGTFESRAAAELIARMQSDTNSLATATAELDERTASSYLLLADAWVKQGKLNEAAECYAKAARAAPNGKSAAIAQSKLAALNK